MQIAVGSEESAEPLYQRLVYAVELIVAVAQHPERLLPLKPAPLKRGGFIKRGRCVCVVFQQFRRPRPVIGQVETAIDFRIFAVPAVCDQIPVFAWNPHLFHQGFVRQDDRNRFAAHGVQRGRGVFDIILDLGQAELVHRPFIPIGLAVHVGEGEPQLFGLGAPVGPLGKHYFLQGRPPPVTGRA